MSRIVTIALTVLALNACTGNTGPAGGQGPAGSDGTNGTNGADGTNGTNGANGSNGADGTNGANGSNGADGTNGANGSNGSNGNDIIISDRAKHGLDISPLAINTTGMTAAQIEAVGQGSYLVNALSDCGSCHGEAGSTTGFLAGGAAFGTVYARNLTPDPTTGLKLTEDQFISAMRTGTDYTIAGATLNVMPWNNFRWASAPDLKAIYAYLKAIPAVSNQVTADTKSVVAPGTAPTSYTEGDEVRLLPLEFDTAGQPIPDPDGVRRGLAIQPLVAVSSPDAATEALIGRGSYLINSLGQCSNCHTNPARITATGKINTAMWLTGGKVSKIAAASQATFGVVRSMSTDLLGATNGFFFEAGIDFAAFEGIIDTGLHIDDPNPKVLASPMPWQHLRDLTLQDFEAIYTYLHAVPGNATSDKATQEASYYCASNADCDTAGGETCDLTSTNTTYHECVGRGCTLLSDCPACQTCSGGNTCGAPLSASCLSGGL